GYLGEKLKDQGISLTGIDLHYPQNDNYDKFYCENLEQFDWGKLDSDGYDMVCLMDILEHLKEPEKLLLALRNNSKLENAIFILSVPNVAFFSIRIGLLFGWFHYADRGILDIDHKRLFTYSSFRDMLKECGFKTSRTIAIPPPFNLISKSFIFDICSQTFNLLNKVLPGLFSFQILKIAKPVPASTNVIINSFQKIDLTQKNNSKSC
ncbi:MAG: methyltransferase domain-containing protein, partial [Candidatus Omnitrophica bacterium]|nr:methyltransferase domain-containing protein [Candidatus Omnitrophota bacterium]